MSLVPAHYLPDKQAECLSPAGPCLCVVCLESPPGGSGESGGGTSLQSAQLLLVEDARQGRFVRHFIVLTSGLK